MLWRTIWGSFVTLSAWEEIQTCEKVFEVLPDLDKSVYYSDNIDFLVTIVMTCCLIDYALYYWLKIKMGDLIFHHAIALIGGTFAKVIDPPFHYYLAWILTAEVVTFTCIIGYFAKIK